MIETSAIVFPSDRGSKLDELRVEEFALKLREERIGNLDWRLRHSVGIGENKLFSFGKEAARAEIGQVRKFFNGGAAGSADRRANVYSKGTPDKSGYAKRH